MPDTPKPSLDEQPTVSLEREAAERWPVGHFLQDEMNARHWTSRDVALRMGGTNARQIAIDQCCVEMTLYIDDPNLLMDSETASKLGRAFDVSPDYFLNLDRLYREWALNRLGGRAGERDV